MISRVSYCGEPPLLSALWASWNLDPVLLFLLAATGVVGLKSPAINQVPSGRSLWMLGLFVLFIAFVSPLCALTNALFSARTVHHLLLISVAAPLFAAALAKATKSDASPHLALFVATAALWFWHWPPAYSSALSSSVIYWVMQLSLLGSALWFWTRVFQQTEPWSALLSILAAMMQMGALGAILAFSNQPFYAEHIGHTQEFGFTALGDQHLAGLVMWVPAMLPYLVIGGLVARRSWRRLQPSA